MAGDVVLLSLFRVFSYYSVPLVLVTISYLRYESAVVALKCELPPTAGMIGGVTAQPSTTAPWTQPFVFPTPSAPISHEKVVRRNTDGFLDCSADFTAFLRQLAGWIGELFVHGDFEFTTTKPDTIVFVVCALPEVDRFAVFMRARQSIHRDGLAIVAPAQR